MNERLIANLNIAFEALVGNQTRSLLTALGIIFGVAAVIAMLAIGNGTQQELNAQMKLVGVNNIVVEPVIQQKEEAVGSANDGPRKKQKYSPGLRLADARAIAEVIPNVQKISPEIIIDTYLINNAIRRSAKLVGVDPVYFDIFNFQLAEGKMFNEQQINRGAPVCIIGQSIQTRFFPTENPIGKKLKVGSQWLEVIGVLKKRLISDQSQSNLGIRDYNMDVYAPLQTVLVRYENRDLVTEQMIETANADAADNDDEENAQGNSGSGSNYHQIDRMVLQVGETNMLSSVADVVSRLLARKHFNVVDYQIQIPELLLKQQKRSNELFNYVLGAIAGISLLVGGIGIMNIMLASVLERIKEIGLRLALGAKKSDIVYQFMFESVLISISGGVIGIALGIGLAYGVSQLAGIKTVVSIASIIISFGVAASIGLVFGITPAKRAANQNPINSLRYE